MTQDKSERRDVLGDILSAREEPDDIDQGLARLIRRDPALIPTDEDGEAERFQGRSGRLWPSGSHETAPALKKKRKTVYLAESVNRKLERARLEIAAMLPEAVRHKVSMSLITDVALRIALGDYAKKGRDSLMVRALRRILVKDDS